MGLLKNKAIPVLILVLMANTQIIPLKPAKIATLPAKPVLQENLMVVLPAKMDILR